MKKLILILSVLFLFSCSRRDYIPLEEMSYPKESYITYDTEGDSISFISVEDIELYPIVVDTVLLEQVVRKALENHTQIMDCEDDFGATYMESVVSIKDFDKVIEQILKEYKQ